MAIIRLRRQVNFILSRPLVLSSFHYFLKLTLSLCTLFITGVATSSAETFVSNNHPVSQADMQDPMVDFLGGHPSMNENDKIIKVSQ